MGEILDTYGRRPRYLTDKRYTFRVVYPDNLNDPSIVAVWADCLQDAVDVLVRNNTVTDWEWIATSGTAAALHVEVK